MPAPHSLAGQQFGDLAAVEPAGSDHTGRTLWRCLCVCGRERIVRTYRLVEGHTTSCGCRLCVECGTRFRDKNIKSRRVTCSEGCETQRKRRHHRDAYHRKPPEKKAEMVARHKKKRKEDPEWAHEVDARKYARIKADQARLARERELDRAWYQANKEKVQEKRRERKESLPPEELERRRRQSREAGRRYCEKVAADPEAAERASAYQREARQKRKAEEVRMQLQHLAQKAEKRLSGEETTPARCCRVCGGPVIGKRPTAVLCSQECRKIDVRLRGRAYRQAQRRLHGEQQHCSGESAGDYHPGGSGGQIHRGSEANPDRTTETDGGAPAPPGHGGEDP